jgi:glycosyltransferase domain-containing protein
MITLLILTMNRSHFLIRLLRYYRDLDFQGCICIGDSSDTSHVERTKKAIKALQGKLNIIYREYPPFSHHKCMEQLLHVVPTPYVACIGDDDFLVPSSLEQCVLFLDSHQDYSAAHGVAGLITLDSNGVHGRVADASYYRQPVIEAASASQRLADHLRNYSVALFSVHRTETYRAMYRAASLIENKTIGGELLPCCISVVHGRIKELDCLYLIRQVYNPRYPLPEAQEGNANESSVPLNVAATTYPTMFGWMTSPDWQPSYEVFRDCLAEELAKRDEISLDAAREVVKKAFWLWLARALSKTWQEHYGQDGLGVRGRARGLGRRIPVLRLVWHTFRSSLPGEDNKMSLQALLRSTSNYHADFMPIYRAVTAPPPS